MLLDVGGAITGTELTAVVLLLDMAIRLDAAALLMVACVELLKVACIELLAMTSDALLTATLEANELLARAGLLLVSAALDETGDGNVDDPPPPPHATNVATQQQRATRFMFVMFV